MAALLLVRMPAAMTRGFRLVRFRAALAREAALCAHALRLAQAIRSSLFLVAVLLTHVVPAPGLTAGAGGGPLGSAADGTHCCGDCDGGATVDVWELVSLVRDALGLAAAPGCDFERIGNCGQFPGQTETTVANLQTAVVRSLRGCSGCPLYFGKGDFESGCTFRGDVELTDGRSLAAEMRVNEVSLFVALTEDEGRLSIFFNDVALVGAPTPTPRIRPGRDFVGQFRIGPEDVLLFTNGLLEIGEDGTTLTLELETPHFGVERIAATYDRECIWSVREGGCQ